MIQIDEDWMATIFCALEDAIKYNDGLRNSQTVKDIEDIEEWLMQLFHCKEYLKDQIQQQPDLKQKLAKYLQR
ncbi:MAG: hypothetical protein KKE30_07530 [Gammaproteobacteria bacterium]|nr:hypothetical protein [Gammaproteobacteria bacterium]MBU1553609.1 hypothetical protein [Gammaproteobacteria bacterium]MBU2070636.1 hypothetical protein [Gammaproteobacteria bacterium]MBU2181850.1 hypothetical protein [Gammaproteobacteria bacterium]MBU2205520.1 hypothetical protein [Gammaproteobacteria bacterium]